MPYRIFFLAFSLLSSPALAEVCTEQPTERPADGFPPYSMESQGDRSQIHLEWMADADPGQTAMGGPSGDWTAWHRVENFHEDPLSFRWEKIGWIVYFDAPIESRESDCTTDNGWFALDSDAPIKTSRGASVNARAYVKVKEEDYEAPEIPPDAEEKARQPEPGDAPPRTGGSIRRGTVTEEGFQTRIAVTTEFTFLPDDGILRTTFGSEGGAFLGWSPDSLAVSFEAALAAIKEEGLDVEVIEPGASVGRGELSVADVTEDELTYLVFSPEGLELEFSAETGEFTPSEARPETRIVMFSPDRLVIGVRSYDVPWAEAEE